LTPETLVVACACPCGKGLGAEGNDMTVERGILLVVGSLTILTVLLAVYHSPNWLWITGLLGAHLIQASFTGYCPVVRTLQKLGLPNKAGFAR
jgi:hypothetical protein